MMRFLKILFLSVFVFNIILSISRRVGKFLLILFFILNAVALYFVNTYSIIVDESMMGNLFNTNFEESSSFFSLKLLVYLFLLGVLPSILIYKIKLTRSTRKSFLISSSLSLAFIIVLAFANSKNWLWIDKNSKTLGGLAMPWSYSVNTSLLYVHESQKNRKEILLPNAEMKDSSKSIVVLVIGESARRKNFSLYGYNKNTNPLLSKTDNLYHFNANSFATYTTEIGRAHV